MKISVVTPTIRPQGLEVVRDSLTKQTFTDYEWLVEINTTGKHDLNSAFNKMLKRAKGELIVFLQDYIKIEEDGLQKFWDFYKENPDTFFTGPVGKVTKWGDEPQWDWRIEREDIVWNECEFDWGAAPKKALDDIGGFDERLDQWWSFDNVSVGKRAGLCGYKFACLPEVRAVALDHDLHEKHPFREKWNPTEVNNILNSYERNPRI